MSNDPSSSLETMLDDVPAKLVAEPAPIERAETGETDAATPAAQSVEPRDDGPLVPRRALEDERKKRQEYERQLAEVTSYIQQNQRQPQQQQQQAPEPPDPLIDPQGYQRYVVEEARMTALSEHVNTSQMLAEEKYGTDVVAAAFEAVRRVGPGLARALMQQRHPYKAMVDWYNQQSALDEIGPDPKAYRERVRAELMAEMNTGSSAAPPRALTSAPVPKSLASATSAVPRDPRSGQFVGRASLDDILG